ncbi:MAG: hypothetical protein AB7O59_10030 [Pirellulales bacterium]
MNAQNSTPSLEEFDGWYNIPDQYHDGIPVLRTQQTVPDFGFEELLSVYKAASKWFSKLIPARSGEPFDPLAESEFVPRGDPRDRTLDIDHVDFRHLSIEHLRRIQNEFLRDHPLWRVVLIADDPACSIVVYPDAIRFGNRPQGADQNAALRELATQALALREARQRPRRKYVVQLQRMLPAGVRAIGSQPFLVCGVLDNCEREYDRLTVALLLRGSDEDAYVMEGPDTADDQFLWRSSAYGVNERGAMISTISIPETAVFCLTPWLPPADYRGQLSIVERKTGTRHIYELRDQDIIRTIGVTQ